MTRFLLISFLFCIKMPIHAQWLPHSMDFYTSYGTIVPLGEKSIADNEFILPSFYNNFNRGTSLTVGTSYKIHPFLSLGLEYNQVIFNDWSFDESPLFIGSKANFMSLGPVFMLHSSFKGKEVENRFKFFVQVTPLIILSENTFNTDFISINPPAEEELQLNRMSWGLKISPGLMYSINQSLGIQIRSNLSFLKAGGAIFNDTGLLSIGSEIGLVYKFKKDKMYYLGR